MFEDARFWVLSTLAVVPYLPAFFGEFLFDDPNIFLGGPPVTRHWIWEQFRGSDRSVVKILDSLLWEAFGINPTGMDAAGTTVIQPSWPWHGLSLAFHLGTVLGVWSLAGLFLEPWKALTAAAIFACHPLQVQAVGYISGRAGVQAFFFAVLGMLHAVAGGWHWAVVPLCHYFSYKSKQEGIFYLLLYPVILWKSYAGF